MNDAINQCFGRTIWTTFTVFIVVLIMYIFGGEGVRGFSFAMLIGVITGAYSTLAIASPMLLTTALAWAIAAANRSRRKIPSCASLRFPRPNRLRRRPRLSRRRSSLSGVSPAFTPTKV